MAMADRQPPRILVFGAHPDDAEVYSGGLVVRHAERGAAIKIVSVTDGRSGHYCIEPDALVGIRRQEAAAAGRLIGADYVTWHFHDGALQPTLEVRNAIIREIRAFAPDLVLAHRPYDYHPDHRAVGMAVQDACYLLTVPHICPEVPALRRDPIVASTCDLFTRPLPMQPDIVLETSGELERANAMAACHASQFFEWLPYHDGVLDEVPEDALERVGWLRGWFLQLHAQRVAHFAAPLRQRGIDPARIKCIEVFELSEYGRRPTPEELDRLFPGRLAAEAN
ncbi:MAG: PIG-L family deacetylase [Planctomycetota bacterium]|nr:MAG: PIG-L family deacetylase [Planctomycetota bacterium]